MQPTSRDAYTNLGDVKQRQEQVYNVIAILGEASNQDIAEYLGLPINSITPRTNELVKFNVVEKARIDVSSQSGRSVILWKVKAPFSQATTRATSRQNRFKNDDADIDSIFNNQVPEMTYEEAIAYVKADTEKRWEYSRKAWQYRGQPDNPYRYDLPYSREEIKTLDAAYRVIKKEEERLKIFPN